MRLDLLLLGFGNVARRFVTLLDERAAVLRDRYDLECRIVGVATGRHGEAFDPAGMSTARLLDGYEQGFGGADLTKSGQTDLARSALRKVKADLAESLAAGRVVVIETTPLDIEHGGQPAIDHVRDALEAAAHVVTANKGPVAFAYRELRSAADLAGRSFLFEGAVMDGIPIFNLVRETLPACEIQGFRGVVNATTNFILTAMERGQRYHDALTEMQRAGIAEADASHDVDGWDAAAKTAALVNVLMGGDQTPLTIAREGIRGITPDRVRAVKESGRHIRLVASAHRDGSQIAARVAPEELDASDPLAQLTGMQNAIILETDLLGSVGVVQLEGGLTQTAYALLSDLVAVAEICQRSSFTQAPLERHASG